MHFTAYGLEKILPATNWYGKCSDLDDAVWPTRWQERLNTIWACVATAITTSGHRMEVVRADDVVGVTMDIEGRPEPPCDTELPGVGPVIEAQDMEVRGQRVEGRSPTPCL